MHSWLTARLEKERASPLALRRSVRPAGGDPSKPAPEGGNAFLSTRNLLASSLTFSDWCQRVTRVSIALLLVVWCTLGTRELNLSGTPDAQPRLSSRGASGRRQREEDGIDV